MPQNQNKPNQKSHSVELPVRIPNSSGKPSILRQYINLLSLRKYFRNSLYLDWKSYTFASFSRKFFSFTFNARSSETLIDCIKSRAKLFNKCWSNSLRAESFSIPISASLLSLSSSSWSRSPRDGSWLKTETCILVKWDTERMADGRQGYSVLYLFLLLCPEVFSEQM